MSWSWTILRSRKLSRYRGDGSLEVGDGQLCKLDRTNISSLIVHRVQPLLYSLFILSLLINAKLFGVKEVKTLDGGILPSYLPSKRPVIVQRRIPLSLVQYCDSFLSSAFT